jgi:ketosteroid isomerase-like protein
VAVSASARSEAWIRRYYERCDDQDIEGAMQYWAPDAVFRFGNDEAVVGCDAIAAKSRQLIESTARQTHNLLGVWDLPNGVVVIEVKVAFVRLDGGQASVGGLGICRVDGERFLEQRIYADLAPVFAPAATAQAAT